MKERKIEARRQLRNPSTVFMMHVQTTGAFNISGAISALLYSSIFISKALRLRDRGVESAVICMEKGSSPCVPEKESPTLEKPGKLRDRHERRGQSCVANPGMQSEVPHWGRWCGEPWTGEQEGALAELVWGALGSMPIKTEIHWFEGASHGSRLCAIRLQPLLSAPCFHKHCDAGVRKTTEVHAAQPPSPLGTEYF